MKKTNLTIGALLLGSVLFVSNFVACSGGDAEPTGQAGTTGASGTTGAGGAGGSTSGSAGTGSAPADGGAGTGPTDGGSSAMLADGKCVTGAFKREGVCVCQGSVPNVCGDICTDVKTDNDNCGACGMKCTGSSTCNAGVCGPAAVAVLPTVAGCGELKIALNAAGDKVYYANKLGGTVGSVAATGGAATPITGATTEKAPTSITVSGTNVLWINNVPGAGAAVASTIRKSANGAAPVDLVSATADGGGIRGLAVSADGNTVYYSTGFFVKSIPMAGGTSTDVAEEEHGGIPGALAIEGTTIVYPTDLNGDVDVIKVIPGTVAKCGKPNAQNPEIYDMVNCVRIARSQGSLRKDAMLAFGGWAYWINGDTLKGGELAPTGTAANDTIGSTLLSPITAMAVNPAKSNIYFTEYDVNMPTGTSGIVQKTGKAKESPQMPVARNQVAPSSIAVSATKVYWAADCGIWSTNP